MSFSLKGAIKFKNRWKVLESAIDQVKIQGLWLEFGVAKGESISFIAENHKGETHGFDTFSGLPENWNHKFRKGDFSNDGSLPSVPTGVILHKGLFQETLGAFLENHVENIAFLHIDSDLYSSAIFVLTTLQSKIVSGTIIVFDDFLSAFSNDEYLAFNHFCEECDKKYRFISYNSIGSEFALIIE